MNAIIGDNIAAIANAIIKEFDIKIPITDMEDVVSRLHGKVEQVDNSMLLNAVERCDEDDDEDAEFIIRISKYQSERSKNFAIAQELGFIFIHYGYMSNWEKWDNYDTAATRMEKTEQDFQAHEFASCLLMPKQDYYDYVYAHMQEGVVDVKEMSQYFRVPRGKVESRGKFVGVLAWR
ncbi:MAG: ImmA/IrrE family metallo-endopeptidase [Eubacteriales bacterium]